MKLQCLTMSMVALFTAVSATSAGDLEPLKKSLTLHASFDNGLNADFSRGDKTCLAPQKSGIGPAVENDDVRISKETGRFGDALHFTKKSRYQPFWPGKDVLNYNDKNWSTSVSIWLKLNPDKDLEPGYCDPVQIVGDDTKKGFIFLEWSKDETPRFFRYAIRPLFELWNPNNEKWDEMPVNKRPMIQVANAPFASDKWTHIVFTLENANDKSKPQSGKLYINGKPIGKIENWDLTFGWNPEKVRLVLGAYYVGQMDDLAIFDRALSDAEVKQIYELKDGIRELYSKSESK